MLRTVQGIIDKEGKLQVVDDVQLPKSRRVLITILDEIAPDGLADTAADEEALNPALLSESALARDWERPEEEEAWSHLSRLPSL